MKHKSVDKTFKYRLMRFIWVKSGDLSRWAGRKMISYRKEAELSRHVDRKLISYRKRVEK
jgi:hypothetical protein